MSKQETNQSHHHNYLSDIRGYNDKRLEYISKTGEILKQYYFSDDVQKKAALLHQYRILMGISKHVNNPKIVREKSRECHNHKPQPFPDPKRKRKPTNLNKHKPNKRTKSTKISSLFPKRGNRNTKRTEKHKNKMTHGKTYNKSPRRINHKATRSKTNTGTTALERSVEQTTGGFKALLQLANFTLGLDATLNT